MSTTNDANVEERGSISQTRRSNSQTPSTPLPWFQLSVITLMRISEPINFTVIFPFISDFIWHLGTTKDRSELGLYAGIIESLFAVCQTCTVLIWAKASDKYGRKPILINGLIGSSISAICVGTSSTFVMLIFSRCLSGALNGNVAVYKAMIGEMSDKTNIARAFSLLSLTWSLGCIIGPLLGGYLSRPAEKYAIFSTKQHGLLSLGGLWERFPFLLPCFIAACFSWFSILLGTFVLKETLPEKNETQDCRSSLQNEANDEAPTERTSLLERSRRDSATMSSYEAIPINITQNQSVSIWSLLRTPQIARQLVSNCLLALCMVSIDSVNVLYFWEPIQLGGLSFPSNITGSLFSASGAWGVIILIVLFPFLQRRYGTLPLFRVAVSGLILVPIVLPLASVVAKAGLIDPINGGRHQGQFEKDVYPESRSIVLVIITAGLLIKTTCAMAYSCQSILINQAAAFAPGAPMATLNGLAQMSFSSMNAFGPYMFSTLYALSLENHILGGYMIWFAIGGIAIVGMIASFSLIDVEEMVNRGEISEDAANRLGDVAEDEPGSSIHSKSAAFFPKEEGKSHKVAHDDIHTRDEVVIEEQKEVKSIAQTGTTPLPWLQLLIIIFMRLSDPISFTFIFLFINDLIMQTDLTQDQSKLGLYSGIIESLFAVSQAFTVLAWARLSDKYGRKPILILGLIGSSIGAIGIGSTSSSFVALVIWRCLSGALNGNVAVHAAMIGEISDKTNQGRAFSLLSSAFPIGLVIGPMLGEYLSKPAEKYSFFSSNSHGLLCFGGLWERHPFLLPSLVVACYSWTAAAVGYFTLKETLFSKVKNDSSNHEHISECTHLLKRPQEADQSRRQTKVNKGTTIQELLEHPQILYRVISSSLLGLCMVSLVTVSTLYFWEPIKNGGLSFSSNITGSLLGMGGAWGAMMLFFIFPYVQKRLGTLKLFQICVSGFVLVSIFLPIASLIAKASLVDPIKGGTTHGKFEQDISPISQRFILAIVAVALFIESSCAMAYPCIAILINQAANVVPGQQRATLNGLTQMSFSAMNALGPYTFSTLYALILHDQPLGGYLIWILTAGIASLGMYISTKLTDLEEASDGIDDNFAKKSV
ncbi:MFS general substrate transporter [Meira miltonrushii]|uniref:MFS general substrate transporter n=1 Tax=Meira miltonrushii TaxID=1280837 RepID=A0A316VE57_9BASI|nr:MFS general substrate transporter [Meira miltonrushii]PWN35967.1 MFS general substrate transporter [Meira miltonrushii]